MIVLFNLFWYDVLSSIISLNISITFLHCPKKGNSKVLFMTIHPSLLHLQICLFLRNGLVLWSMLYRKHMFVFVGWSTIVKRCFTLQGMHDYYFVFGTSCTIFLEKQPIYLYSILLLIVLYTRMIVTKHRHVLKISLLTFLEFAFCVTIRIRLSLQIKKTSFRAYWFLYKSLKI